MNVSAIGNWNQGAAAEFSIFNQPNRVDLPAIGMSWHIIRVGCNFLTVKFSVFLYFNTPSQAGMNMSSFDGLPTKLSNCVCVIFWSKYLPLDWR